MSIGVLAHLCRKGNFEEVASSVGSYEFSHVQLALWKAFDNYDFTEPGLLSPGLAKKIREELVKRGVSISVLGSYLHLFDRDENVRRKNIERFKEIIRYARFFGAPVVATETGKLPFDTFTDEDWETMRSTVQELIAEAEKWGIFIGIEPAEDHLIDNAVKLKKLLEEVPSTNLGVVLDPGNLITKSNLHEQNQVIEEMFDLLGDRIVAFQAKDCLIDENGEYKWVPIGKGKMNYDLIFQKLWEHKPHVDIILDAVKPETMIEAKKYIETKLSQLNNNLR